MRRRSLSIVAALVVGLSLGGQIGCATLAPGADPVVVRAQQTLEGADAIYKDAMEYYFTPGVADALGNNAVHLFESVRTGYDKPYKAAQTALDSYRAVRAGLAAGDLAEKAAKISEATRNLASFINQVLGILPKAAATRSGAKPIEGG